MRKGDEMWSAVKKKQAEEINTRNIQEHQCVLPTSDFDHLGKQSKAKEQRRADRESVCVCERNGHKKIKK